MVVRSVRLASSRSRPWWRSISSRTRLSSFSDRQDLLQLAGRFLQALEQPVLLDLLVADAGIQIVELFRDVARVEGGARPARPGRPRRRGTARGAPPERESSSGPSARRTRRAAHFRLGQVALFLPDQILEPGLRLVEVFRHQADVGGVDDLAGQRDRVLRRFVLIRLTIPIRSWPAAGPTLFHSSSWERRLRSPGAVVPSRIAIERIPHGQPFRTGCQPCRIRSATAPIPCSPSFFVGENLATPFPWPADRRGCRQRIARRPDRQRRSGCRSARSWPNRRRERSCALPRSMALMPGSLSAPTWAGR